jgi:hypothetical protein
MGVRVVLGGVKSSCPSGKQPVAIGKYSAMTKARRRRIQAGLPIAEKREASIDIIDFVS